MKKLLLILLFAIPLEAQNTVTTGCITPDGKYNLCELSKAVYLPAPPVEGGFTMAPASPQTHIEHGVVYIPAGGKVDIGFEQNFSAMPVCKAAEAVKFEATSREGATIMGKAGTKVHWACK